MKKTLLTTAAVLGTLAIGAGVSAAEIDTNTTDGTVGFTTPADGALTLTEVADLDFGNNPISADDEEYGNKTAAKTSVQDIRGTLAGWTVQVAQEAQFKNGDSELENAQITFVTPTLDADSQGTATVSENVALKPTGETATILTAANGEGAGKTVELFDTDSVTLSVQGDTSKVIGSYSTTLTWSLNDTVDNA